MSENKNHSRADEIEFLKSKGWYDLNVSAGNYRIPMPYVLEFLDEYALLKTSPLQEQLEKLHNDFLKQIGDLNFSLKTEEAYAKSLEAEIEKLKGGRGNKTPTDEEIMTASLRGSSANFIDPLNRSGFIEGAYWVIGKMCPGFIDDHDANQSERYRETD